MAAQVLRRPALSGDHTLRGPPRSTIEPYNLDARHCLRPLLTACYCLDKTPFITRSEAHAEVRSAEWEHVDSILAMPVLGYGETSSVGS